MSRQQTADSMQSSSANPPPAASRTRRGSAGKPPRGQRPDASEQLPRRGRGRPPVKPPDSTPHKPLPDWQHVRLHPQIQAPELRGGPAELRQALSQRLAVGGGPRACAAANALLALADLFELPGPLCEQLVAHERLWDSLQGAPADLFSVDPGTPPDPEPVALVRPGKAARRCIAEAIAALLDLGDTATAQRLLRACREPAHRRLLLKRLLSDEHHRDGLARFNRPDAIDFIDAVFTDMLDHPLHADRYQACAQAIATLRAQWGRAGASPPPGTEGTRAAVFDRLRGFGVDLGDGTGVVLDTVAGKLALKQQLKALGTEQIAALKAYALSACSALFDTGEAPAIECLLLLNLWLHKDIAPPALTPLQTDEDLQAAAQRALARHGQARLWLMTQRWGAEGPSACVYPTLLANAHTLDTAPALLCFVDGVMRFLAQQQRAHGPSDDRRLIDREVVERNRFLRQLIDACATRLPALREAPSPASARLAQWLWFADALLRLLPQQHAAKLAFNFDSAFVGPCLAFFHAQGEPFASAVDLLRGPALSRPQPAMRYPDLESLFARCTPLVLMAVLGQPFAQIWPVTVLVDRATTTVTAALVTLLDHDGLLPLLEALGSQPILAGVPGQALAALGAPGGPKNLRPRGLPVLLQWCQRLALRGSAADRATAVAQLMAFAQRYRSQAQATDEEVAAVGCHLPLGPTPSDALHQLEPPAPFDPLPSLVLLQGWLRQQICLAASPSPPGAPVAFDPALFVAVYRHAKGWLQALRLPAHHRLAIELKTLRRDRLALSLQ